MTQTILITMTPDDLQTMLDKAIAPLQTEIAGLNAKVMRKKTAYTVAEVAEQIGYSAGVVREFIREGRKDRSGKMRRLPHKEITTGNYRILPEALDEWLSYF